MKDYQFRAITGQDIPSMTRLLMARQERESQLFPFLKNSFLQTGRLENSFKICSPAVMLWGWEFSSMASSLAILWGRSGLTLELVGA